MALHASGFQPISRGEQGREPADAIAMLSGDVLANIGSDGHSLEHFLACAIEFTLKHLYLQLGFRSIKFGPIRTGSKHGAIKIAFERCEARNGRVQVDCLEVGAQIAHCIKCKFTFTDCVVGLRERPHCIRVDILDGVVGDVAAALRKYFNAMPRITRHYLTKALDDCSDQLLAGRRKPGN